MTDGLYSQKIIKGVEVSVLRNSNLFRDPTEFAPYESDEPDAPAKYVAYVPGRKSPILITDSPPTESELENAVENPGSKIRYFGKNEISNLVKFLMLLIGIFIVMWIGF